MDDEVYKELSRIVELDSKRSYSNEEVQWVYKMYNRLNPTSYKNPTSCGKCSKSVFQSVRRSYDQEYKRRTDEKTW